MKVWVPNERSAIEERVALTPDAVKRLPDWEIAVETGAGDAAGYADAEFAEAGAKVLGAMPADTGLVVRLRPPTIDEVSALPAGVTLLSFYPLTKDPPAPTNVDVLRGLAEKKATVFAFDLLPRISRAQSMDALSSQATVAGYRAGLTAAEEFGRFFPMLMTAAGTVPPAKILVMGVGVAGLQAIATARRLGGVVRAYDVRAAAKEEAESLGATFVDLGVTAEGTGGYARELTEDELGRQREALAAEVAGCDILITTAAVPGRTVPVLVTRAMIEKMAPGSVVVDMAADSGGNCEPSVAGETVTVTGTRVVGMQNPASGLPAHASFLYGRNVMHFLTLLGEEPDWEDEIVKGSCVMRSGEAMHERAQALVGTGASS